MGMAGQGVAGGGVSNNAVADLLAQQKHNLERSAGELKDVALGASLFATPPTSFVTALKDLQAWEAVGTLAPARAAGASIS